jgi:hypothetical protein
MKLFEGKDVESEMETLRNYLSNPMLSDKFLKRLESNISFTTKKIEAMEVCAHNIELAITDLKVSYAVIKKTQDIIFVILSGILLSILGVIIK